MSVEIKNANNDVWFIAKSEDNSVIHSGVVQKGGCMKSGQKELEVFDNEQDQLDRLEELNK